MVAIPRRLRSLGQVERAARSRSTLGQYPVAVSHRARVTGALKKAEFPNLALPLKVQGGGSGTLGSEAHKPHNARQRRGELWSASRAGRAGRFPG